MFFSFDGIDGVGKTTQLQLFCQWLRSHGHPVVTCRDPGSTPLGERIRDILLHGGAELPITLRTEMLLYMAARAQLVEEIIRPALENGQIVVSDRFLLANIAYQAFAGGLDANVVRDVGCVATAGIIPDCVFLLDMSEITAQKRLARELDRMEQQSEDYRLRLREGFLAEARRDAQHIHVVDAAQSIDQLQAQIQQLAKKVLDSIG
jgi:dTMP kinase